MIRAAGALVPCAVLPCALLLCGCGYIGEPLPPALSIPTRVANLSAVQRGENIIVQFTLPSKTTEGLPIKRDVDVELRIGSAPTPFNLDEWLHESKRIGAPAGIERVETPATPWYDKQVILGLRLVNPNGRDSGWSNLFAMTVMPPVPQPVEVTAMAVATGVALAWKSPPGDFLVFRRGPRDQAFAHIGESKESRYTDTSAEFGQTYRYLVQAVKKTGESQAESELSSEIEITPKDTFAPAVPAGLVAVLGTKSIELVWDRNTESDLAGYRVYRGNEPGKLERVVESQEGPSYSDRKIEPGKKYVYAVSAVDKNGNESKPSEPVEVVAP